MIETLDDIAEHLADELGIYGAHPEHQNGHCRCRVCWASNLKSGILRAVEIERKLQTADRPRIVCLCGSTRFADAFKVATFKETMAGRIVLSVGCFMHADRVVISHDEKQRLDELHKRKIDLADEILVLNVGGYIGDSTRGEIAYAAAHDKPCRWLEDRA